MVPNAVLKSIDKLMLNSFWGKFGMRDNLCQTEFIYSPKRYFDLMRSKSKVIHDVHIVTEQCVMVTFSIEDDYNEGNDTSNLAIAAITTSYARMRLLTMLRQLGDRVLYFDTDSVIYVSKPGEWEPTLGNVLGDWVISWKKENRTSSASVRSGQRRTPTPPTQGGWRLRRREFHRTDIRRMSWPGTPSIRSWSKQEEP